jgi:hypothetical protein
MLAHEHGDAAFHYVLRSPLCADRVRSRAGNIRYESLTYVFDRSMIALDEQVAISPPSHRR